MKPSEPTEQLEDVENIKKYKSAGLISTKTVNEILKHAKVGSKLVDLLKIGNDYVNTECNKIYEDITHKGLSFPLCLSVNEIACYYIPTQNEVLKDGDLLKIELSTHIDGFSAPICYTSLICNTKINDKKKENLLRAVTETSVQIMKSMKPSTTNIEIAKIMESNAKKYKCYLPLCMANGKIAGEFSNQISQYVFDGNNDDDDEFIHNFILTKTNPKFDFTMQESQFEENEVYVIDILMCSGPSKLIEYGKCDIYKRTKHVKLLKLNSSKDALNKFKGEIYPMSIVNCDTKIRLGIKECIEKKLVDIYPVVKCNKDDYICRVMFTVIIGDEPTIISGKSATSEFEKFM